MNWFDHGPVDVHLADFASALSHYWVWLVLAVVIVIHTATYNGAHKLLARWLDPEERLVFLMMPLPWWMHLFVLHLSILFTIVIIWLIALPF